MNWSALATRSCPGTGLLHIVKRWPRSIQPQTFPPISVVAERGISTPAVGQQQVDNIHHVRNIGIIAHVDAGKTTTTEAMLYNSGATRHLGNVDHGDTVMDFLPMEMKRGITIQSAAITFRWPTMERLKPGASQHTINLIDTPGHQDFRFEVERCMPVLDGAVCIIDGVEGVEAHTERVWSSAQEFNVPRIVLINKLDRDGASFKKSVQDVGLKLNGMPLVCQIPWWENDVLKGIVDVLSGSVVSWTGREREDVKRMAEMVPPFPDEIERARENLIEQLCEHDDELLERWTEHGKNLAREVIQQSIRRVINRGDAALIPVFAGSSLKNIGVASLLDAVTDYLPSPQDRPCLQVRVGSTMRPYIQVVADSHSPKIPKKERSAIEALASVFKVVNDAKHGMLTFVRIYYGALRRNMPLWNANLQESERPLKMSQISANRHVEVAELSSGHIGALTGLKKSRTGDTLLVYAGNKTPHGQFGGVQVRPPDIPPAVAFIVLEALSPSGARAVESALSSLSREDPSLRWSLNEKTERYTLSGMGKLHLEVARDRLESHYNVEAYWGTVEVDYKECVTSPTGRHHAVVDKVIAGKAGRAACSATVDPLDGSDVEANDIERDGNLIRFLFPAEAKIERETIKLFLLNGVLSALARGPRRCSPMNSCLVRIAVDETESSSAASAAHWVSAAEHAVRTALKAAHKDETIGILEPMMRVNISCPETVANSIQHDLHAARGGQVLEVRDVQGSYAREGGTINASDIYAPPDPYDFQTTLRETRKGSVRMLDIVAQVPLAEMLDYDAILRGKTAGRHSLSMYLDKFERVSGIREKCL